MSVLRSDGRGSFKCVGLSLLVCSTAWNCAKGPPPAARETADTATPAKSTSAPTKAEPATAGPTKQHPSVDTGTTANVPATAKQTDFALYWRELRPALQSGNAESVANLAAFPFTVRGEMDDDPIRQIERPAFAPILRQLLAQDVGLSPDPEPLSQYVKRMNAAPTGAVSGTTARVASMQFALGPDGWRFVGAYLGDGE